MAKRQDILRSSIIQGFGTLVIREFFIKFFSFIGQLFLARILYPSDFGIYVIIVFIISLPSLFSDIGLSAAIIQQPNEPTHEELSIIFYLKIILSIVAILIVWISAPVVTNIYHSFAGSQILMLRVFSLTILLASLRAIPTALLERKIEYNIISFVDIIGIVVYYVVALTAAVFHFGVWSFIIAVLIKDSAETIIINSLQPFLPVFNLQIIKIKSLIKFGLFIQGNSFISFLNTSISPAIGGKMSGPSAVGLLDFANSLASLPETIAINFGRVAFTGYSRIQEQRDLLELSIKKSVNMLAIILYIFPVVIFCFGRELVHVIYTDKWLSAVPALYWFAAAAFFQPVTASLGQGILSIGKSVDIFKITFITTAFGWISAILLIYIFGFTGIAIASFFVSALLCYLYIFIFKSNGFSLPYFVIFSRKIAVVMVAIGCGYFVNLILPNGLVALFVKLLSCLIVYLLGMYLLEGNDVRELFGLMRSLVRS